MTQSRADFIELLCKLFGQGRGGETAFEDSNAPYQRQSEPTMVTLDGYLNHQRLLLLPPGASLLAPERIAIRRTHLPLHPNPHSQVRGAFCAPSPAGSFFGGFRTTAPVQAAPDGAVTRNPSHYRRRKKRA